MYSSTYLTVRVHTKEEAEAVFPSETVDLMMWLIDVYDIQTGCAPAVHKVLMAKYHTEAERVPGILPKWTRTMMIWVTLLHCSVTSASSTALDWAAKHNLRINAEACEKWTVDDLLLALDALAQRWHQLPVKTELERHAVRQYLEVLFGLARKWTMHRHPRLGMTETSMTSMTISDADWLVLAPTSVVAMMSRYYWFHQTLAQVAWFPAAAAATPVHYFDRFVQREQRHLKIRKFRDELCKCMWERMLLYGDREIVEHRQGDPASAYTCLYKRHPVCLMQTYQQVLSYGTYEEICALRVGGVRFEDILWLKLIQYHFVNNFHLDFLEVFVCWEEKQHKHRQALETSTVPLIVQRFGGFVVLHGGRTHEFPSGSVRDAFPCWVALAHKGKAHGCELDMLYKQVFSKEVAHMADDIGIVAS